MTDYQEAIAGSMAAIERTFRRDDLESIGRHEMASLILEVYDILSDAVAPDWWDRDKEAEDYMKESILQSF